VVKGQPIADGLSSRIPELRAFIPKASGEFERVFSAIDFNDDAFPCWRKMRRPVSRANPNAICCVGI
jgi:hypothetical protein